MRASIRIGPTHAEKVKNTSSAELLFLLAGVCGLLTALQGLPGVTWNMPAVYGTAVVMSAALWYTYALGRGWFAAAFLIIVGACGIVEIRQWALLGSQVEEIIRGLTTGAADAPADVTVIMLIFAALLSLLLFLCEIWMRSSLLLLLLTILVVLCGPIIGLQSGYAAVILLFGALCAFAASHAAGPWRRGVALADSRSSRGTVKRAAAACLAALLVFLAAVPLTTHGQDAIYQTVYAAEGAVQRAVRQITGADAISVSNGTISRGNRYPTGTIQMEIVTNRMPTQPLYLRGFTGADYAGGEWTQADSETLSEQIRSNLSRGPASWSMSGINYFNLYFVLNTISAGEPPYVVTIQPAVASGINSYYEPYYSSWTDNWLTESGYGFRYFQPEQMHIEWENIAGVNNGWLQVIAQRIQDAYLQAVQTLYTAAPDRQLPRLAALCEANPQQGLENVTAFILDTLHSCASYSTTPGLAPLNEDIVEYFLFENGEGYCVHFAAAATLMYRMYGIPARYVSGYMVQPADFTEGEDGLYHAQVTDADAHAWTELFMEDKGWTPVEVTPAAQEPEIEAVEGNGAVADTEQTETPSSDAGQTAGTTNRPEQEETAQEQTQPVQDTSATQQVDSWKTALFCALAGMALVVLALGLLVWQRRWRLHQLYRSGCRVLFDRLLAMLAYTGRLQGCTGHEPDFALRLCAAAPAVSREDAQRLADIVSRAAFGPHPPLPEEDAFVSRLYRQIAASCSCDLSPVRRLLFRYVKAYG